MTARGYKVLRMIPVEGTPMYEVFFTTNGLTEQSVTVMASFVGSEEMHTMIARIVDTQRELKSALGEG